MPAINAGAIVKLHKDGRHLKICLFSNPGPFPFGAPRTMGTAQYFGIADHLVLTLMEDKYLPGMAAFLLDVPMLPDGTPIRWCGGVACQPWKGDIWYQIHTLFVRDVDQLLADAQGLQLAARVTGVHGVVSRRPYWLVEIPAITPEVLLNIDEIVIVRRRKAYVPESPMSSKVSRGEFWQTASFMDHDGKTETTPHAGQSQEKNQGQDKKTSLRKYRRKGL